MTAYGGHIALTCFEHIFAYILGTACDSSMKICMHIYMYLEWGYLYI